MHRPNIYMHKAVLYEAGPISLVSVLRFAVGWGS